MEVTTSGRFRVFDSPRDASELLLIDVGCENSGGGPGTATTGKDADAGGPPEEAYAPTYVRRDDRSIDAETAKIVASLRPGYLVDATLGWAEGTPRFVDVVVRRRTLVEFVDGATGIFEAAREAWRSAEADGEAMNSQLTRSTDGDPNGVLYVFAKQRGARDLFEEFRSGVLPLEPLLDRVDEAEGDASENRTGTDREVFVIRPADEPFVLVYIVLRKESLLADTVRSTYDCPRPEETEP